MTTINILKNKAKAAGNLNFKKNEKQNLLHHLKKVEHSSFSLIKLKELVNQKESYGLLTSSELIAIMAMLPKEHQLDALSVIKNNFDLVLTGLEREALKKFLLKDHSSSALDQYSILDFHKVLTNITKYRVNKRLQQIQSLSKQYQLFFSDRENLKTLISCFNKKDFLNLVKTPIIWEQIIKINQGKRPVLPLNEQQAIKLLEKLKLYSTNFTIFDSFQTFIKQLSITNERNQLNLLLSLQSFKPEVLMTYLKTSENIAELFRWIPENSVRRYLELPFIASAINKVSFSWNNIVDMLKNSDNKGAYVFIDYLLKENKISNPIDIEQLKILLRVLDYEKRLGFFNMLKLKHLISEINVRDNRIVELLPNKEDYWNNNIPQQPLFFWNKAFNLTAITEEPNENIYENKNLNQLNRYSNRHI